MSVSDDFVRVLKEAKLGASEPEGGWLKRSEVVNAIYGDGMPVNAHHRAIFSSLVSRGQIEQRVARKGHLDWFEYRSL